MTNIEAERIFAEFVAEKLGLELDAEIFRGGIPANRPGGVGVILSPSGAAQGYGARTAYQGQIIAKFEVRDDALELLDKLEKIFPVYGAPHFPCIVPSGSSEPYSGAERGAQKWYVSYNLDVAVC